jgi:hypothetical protein
MVTDHEDHHRRSSCFRVQSQPVACASQLLCSRSSHALFTRVWFFPLQLNIIKADLRFFPYSLMPSSRELMQRSRWITKRTNLTCIRSLKSRTRTNSIDNNNKKRCPSSSRMWEVNPAIQDVPVRGKEAAGRVWRDCRCWDVAQKRQDLIRRRC